MTKKPKCGLVVLLSSECDGNTARGRVWVPTVNHASRRSDWVAALGLHQRKPKTKRHKAICEFELSSLRKESPNEVDIFKLAIAIKRRMLMCGAPPGLTGRGCGSSDNPGREVGH